jgi:SAM-dependent methyltransferase
MAPCGADHPVRIAVAVDWRIKALGHWVISLSPRSDALGYLMQRRITRTLPMPDRLFEDHVAAAERHLGLATAHLGREPASAYEFGAGWDLVIPLVLARAGLRSQTVTDIRRLLRDELVADAAERLGIQPDLDGLGIRYLAPIDAMATGLPAGSFDLVTSTDTLEHVPRRQLAPLLRECRRLLRPDGVLTARIDYRDHYAYGDARLGPFAFLRYDRRHWRRWNPPSHYQSRLRHVDHVRAIEAAGFELLAVEHPEPSIESLGRVHAEFDGYQRHELAIAEGWIVARPLARAPSTE